MNNRLRASHSDYNKWQHWRRDDGRARFTTAVVRRRIGQDAVLIFAHLYLKPEYLSSGGAWEGSECGNKISDANFLIVFHSNYGSILLSFRDMTTGRSQTTEDGPTTVTIAYLALKASQQQDKFLSPWPRLSFALIQATSSSGLLSTFDIPEGDQVSPFSSVIRLTWRRLLRWSADVCIELCNSFKSRCL